MRKDHHEEFISFKDKDGNVSNAFITGVPDKCDHDDNGEELSFNAIGQYFKASDMPNPKTNYDAWVKFQEDNKINGGCTSCSKCGKPFEIDLFNCE